MFTVFLQSCILKRLNVWRVQSACSYHSVSSLKSSDYHHIYGSLGLFKYVAL
uniref:Uncharacterized protein n=1 Tax=Oryza brachyantha TaxID=4533 RepID=J3L197_ORYBR